MAKRLVMLGLLNLVLVNGAWSQVPGNGSGQHDKAQDKQETANPSKPVVAIESPAGANKQDHASGKSAKYPWGELLAPANIPNWFLVVVGGVTGWFVYKTLKAIKRQVDVMESQAKDVRESGAEASRIALATAKAARKAADAAEISARASMGVAVPTLHLHKFIFVPQRGLYQYDSFSWPKVIIEVKNFGQSPAILKAYMLSFSWEDELPEEPIYDFPYPCDVEEVIDPGKTHQFDPESTVATRETPLQVAYDLEAGKRRLTVYGYISYGDIFGSPIRYMKFSKRVMETHTDGSGVLLDYGGHKYTGQQEHYDTPNHKWPNPN
jgi:hypothetical protein